jgi:hypothetical protein
MNFEIKKLNDKQTAIKIGEFLIGPTAFEQTWAPNEKEFVLQAPVQSIGKPNHRYWYIEDGGNIVGAIGSGLCGRTQRLSW